MHPRTSIAISVPDIPARYLGEAISIPLATLDSANRSANSSISICRVITAASNIAPRRFFIQPR